MYIFLEPSPHECEVSANCPDSHICKTGGDSVRACESKYFFMLN